MTNSTPDVSSPIQDFSQCHVGILNKLDQLGELPGLLDAANRARQSAQQMLDFFREAIYEHHSEEERELFPAVQASATPGAERDQVKQIAEKLTREHRDLEAQWKLLEPHLKRAAKGQDASVPAEAVAKLVTQYSAHARYEEAEYLPLAYTILSRHSNRMDALALALHLRHQPQVVGYV
jgi:hemerythrin-like domain-containing protein